jgi:hypothetical protein
MSANGILPTIQQNLNVQIASPQGSLVVVNAAAVQVIGANAARRGIIFINASPTRTITLTPDNQTPVAGQGIVILPQGQQPFIGDGTLVNYNCGWKAIADGVGAPLQMLELL